ncbi:glycosyltransferase [Desulfonatronum lacustre]|uniref:glycosyltransferase n=1 Tax=Desulfonatronum lacustre TaxID=66849 RepID=UPI00048F75A4|nr:glycosyltransferase [Desulfonatronum lacustre]
MNTSHSLNGKTVLHVLDRSIPNLSGYSIRSKYIVDFQARNGLSPLVATTPKYERTVAHEKINGVEYHRSYEKPGKIMRILQKIPFLREQCMMLQVEKRIEELVQTRQVDIIHAHSPSLCGLPALKVARRMNKPMVYEVRAFWEDAAVDRKRFAENSLKYRISGKIEQKLFDQADCVVCICEGLRKEIAERRSKPGLSIVPNGVDASVFIPLAKSQKLIAKYHLQGKVVIGFIGSFFTFEGLADLIQCIPKVSHGQRDVAFLLVGTGVEDQNLRNLAEKLELDGRTVIFTGRVPHEDVPEYYSIIDILVYPRISKRITELVTPLKPLEAMAMEKAVLVSDVGGLKELVSDGQNGFVFKAGDINDLADKLIYLASHLGRCREIGRQARKDVIAKRDWSVVVQGYFEIYAGLLNGKTQAQ